MGTSAGIAAVAVLLAAYTGLLLYDRLPSLAPLLDYHPHLPLRIYTEDGALIGEFGEERRAPVRIADVPARLREAILAAEDERFYQHHGIDYLGIARAAIANFRSSGVVQGASTITMQVARNFYLTREKTWTRKIHEALLALKIDYELTKDQILELYVNQIYLGERAYGFAAAADIYFGKTLDQLTLAEMTMLAGLPKAPSRDNPPAYGHLSCTASEPTPARRQTGAVRCTSSTMRLTVDAVISSCFEMTSPVAGLTVSLATAAIATRTVITGSPAGSTM